MMPSQAQIDEVLANPEAYSDNLVREAKRLKTQQGGQTIPTVPNPTVDPTTGQPTGGAPAPMVNLGASAINFGNDMVSGFGNLLSSPIDTIKGIPQGVADHYSGRYGSPESAINTAMSDPFGAMMDVVPVGSALRLAGWGAKGAGLSRTGEVAGQVGRTLERADPAGLAVGAAQTGFAGLMNKFADSPEAHMAGTYGQPRGRQVDNLTDYMGIIGDAMDRGIPPTPAGQQLAIAASDVAGGALNDVLKDAAPIDKVGLVKELIKRKQELSSNLDAPAHATLDKLIDDIIQSGGADSTVIPAVDANALKSRYDAEVNYTAQDTKSAANQVGAKKGADVIRDEIRQIEGAKPLLDEYGRTMNVRDVVTRGAARDVAESGQSFSGSWVSDILSGIPAVLTGQGKLQRNKVRRNLSQNGILSAMEGATTRSVYGPIREGAYLADKTRKENPNESESWHVGRLWSN